MLTDMYIQYTLADFLCSMRWLWIFVIILSYRLCSRCIKSLDAMINIKRESLIKDVEYDEEKIIKHVDFIINEALDRYVIINITPKTIYYINSKEEKKIVEYLTDTIPERISPALYSKLSLVYNTNYIPSFLGEHIYMIVTNYVLEFNLNQDPDKIAARQESIDSQFNNELSDI